MAELEATIASLQQAMAAGATTSEAITRAYLERIDRLNPMPHAVLETNPDALDIARARDRERRHGRRRGPLHGIPVLAHSQDTAGPMARTVTDAAVLLGVLRSPFVGPGLVPPPGLPRD